MNANERGEGLLDYVFAIGGLALLVIAGASFFAPVMEARLLEAQAARDIARANATMAQGLADVARINAVAAMTPMLLLLAVIAVALAVISLAVVAIVYLRRRYPRQWRTIEPPPVPPVVISKRQPALTEEPAALFLVPRERQRSEVRR